MIINKNRLAQLRSLELTSQIGSQITNLTQSTQSQREGPPKKKVRFDMSNIHNRYIEDENVIQNFDQGKEETKESAVEDQKSKADSESKADSSS